MTAPTFSLRTLVPGILLAITGCSDPRPSTSLNSPDDAETELRARVERYYQTLSARDWQAYRGFFWPDASLTTVWQPPDEPSPRVVITSIDQFIAATGQGPDSKPIFEENLLSQEVRILENMAQVWARYEARFGDSTAVARWHGVDAFTWMKHDGEWRIVSMAYTNDPEE